MLMYYVDFIAFMENPEKTCNDFLAKEMQKAPLGPSLFDQGGLLLKKLTQKSYFTGLRGRFLCSFEFYRTAINLLMYFWGMELYLSLASSNVQATAAFVSASPT